MHQARQRQVIADEVRRVLRDHHALAQAMICERGQLDDDVSAGLSGRDELQQVQIPRWVEKVCAEPMAPEIIAAALGQRMDGDARCIRADDRARAPGLIHASEQPAFHVELFDDSFNDPVGFTKPGETLVEAGCRDEPPGIGREERIGLECARALESVGGSLGRDVEQEGRHASVCGVRRDLGSHHAGAQHGDRANHRIKSTLVEAGDGLQATGYGPVGSGGSDMR